MKAWRVFVYTGLVLFFFGVVPKDAAARKSPEATYDIALNYLKQGTFDKAIKLFRKVLYPSPGTLTDPRKKNEGHKHLGVAYYYSKKRQQARREFERYLYAYPRRTTINRARYPSDMVRFFKKVRKGIEPELNRILESKRKPRIVVQVVKLRIDRRVEVFNPAICVIPFGIPHLLKGRPIKGGLLLGSQALFLGLNIGGFLAVSSMQITDPNSPQLGRFPVDLVDAAVAWQIIQFSSLGAFAASYVAGVIDCAVNLPRKRESMLPDLPAVDPRRFKMTLPTSTTPSKTFYSTQ